MENLLCLALVKKMFADGGPGKLDVSSECDGRFHKHFPEDDQKKMCVLLFVSDCLHIESAAEHQHQFTNQRSYIELWLFFLIDLYVNNGLTWFCSDRSVS